MRHPLGLLTSVNDDDPPSKAGNFGHFRFRRRREEAFFVSYSVGSFGARGVEGRLLTQTQVPAQGPSHQVVFACIAI